MTHHVALRERLTAAVTALSTLAVTLALLVGMPSVLWHAAHIPWPDNVHSWHELGERLSQPVSDPLVIDMLAVAGWVCWAAFAFTVVREICWYAAHLPQLLHDRRAHHDHMATLSLKSSLAALCIGTLAVALLSLWRPTTASAQQPSWAHTVRPPTAVTAPLDPSTGQNVAARVTAAPRFAEDTEASVHLSHSEREAGAAATRHFEYVVKEGDTLWDVAHAHLGDALKWPRIYALNKDRVQPDGSLLTDPDLLKPGWQLTIPVSEQPTSRPSNHGPARPAAPPTESQTSSAPPASARPAPDQTPSASQQSAHTHTHTQTQTHARPRLDGNGADRKVNMDRGPAAIGFGEASLIGITAAAGLLAARRYWYLHQRRTRRPDDEATAPALSPLVDKAAQAAQAATQPRRPHDPEALVIRRTPPQQPLSPGTVTIGVDDNAEVPLDVLAIAGGCTWTGPGPKAPPAPCSPAS
ncbi:LysM peptidoglycan-binding domain-containing protein [Streptomyces endophytica]|uniref:LysM peptidoglycan-binding domain-containing protein n=1 Tax=Streptomyces endophytica TaxID=2991496 RepID=A0ABY6PHW2_9ACTN|nr:LysM peptidoglycan-binding domain-containing protein [Streptomyces endophytica]UZJ33478.1 LysM peptidoglycan-binding domain-containing protein [Streptomyces endophytica]